MIIALKYGVDLLLHNQSVPVSKHMKTGHVTLKFIEILE